MLGLLLLTATLQLCRAQDLKSIFHTPTKRNYDDFEILERANFPKEDAAVPNSGPPKAYANAQVSLKFGNIAERCACGDVCQCNKVPVPVYVPVFTPLPYSCSQTQLRSLPFAAQPRPQYCLSKPMTVPLEPRPQYLYKPLPILTKPHSYPSPCYHSAPFTIRTEPCLSKPVQPQLDLVGLVPESEPVLTPLPTPPKKEEEPSCQIDNSIDEKQEKIENSFLEIQDPVDSSNESLKANETACLEEVIKKLIPTEFSPNVKLVSLDLSKAEPSCENDINNLDDSVIPYYSPKHLQTKFLVSYPIFNKDIPGSVALLPNCDKPKKEIIVPIFNRPKQEIFIPVGKPQAQVYQSGYGCYSDPIKTIFYKKPTILTYIYPGKKGVEYDPAKYTVISHHSSKPRIEDGHDRDCSCCSCAKYLGELNEKSS